MKKDINMQKRVKITFLSIIFITVGILAIIIYWQNAHSPSKQQLILNEAKMLSFHGRIDSIYFDKANHNAETLMLSNGYRYWLYPNWSSLVVVGDSLSKEYGEVKVKVYKKNMTVDTLDYLKLIKLIR